MHPHSDVLFFFEVIEMAFLQVQYYSKVLNVCSTVNVILPEADQGIGVDASKVGKLPKVLYLLHGYSDDHSIWMRRTSVERYAAQHNLAVIMPAVNHSFYCNEVQGERYWDYVSEELPKTMHTFFRLSDKPEDTFVAGLSMGGYGAMKLALSYPERFGAAASFSGVTDIADMSHRSEQSLIQMDRIFGSHDSIAGTDDDLQVLGVVDDLFGHLVATHDKGVSVGNGLVEVVHVGIFLKESQLIAVLLHHFADAVHGNLCKRFFSCN